MTSIVGLGGGCHWCTEGIFQSLIGIQQVKQGWIAPKEDISVSYPNRNQNSSRDQKQNYSEAIEVYFDPNVISLATLIEIHLYTHASTSNHSMRDKYRSAVYTYSEDQRIQANQILDSLKDNFEKPLITKVYPFDSFKPNEEKYRDYFYQAPDKPFCQRYIHPKLKLLLARFKIHVDKNKLKGVTLESL